MPDRLRFHIDESLSPGIARGARAIGVDVTDSHEAHLLQASDEVQWEYCLANNRVIVTADQDFFRIASAFPDHPGIIYCKRRAFGALIKRMALLENELQPDEMRGRIEYV
jgi:predicted nuclease of predicted toxin-antitoxin system